MTPDQLAARGSTPFVVFAAGATIETAMLPFRLLQLAADFGLQPAVALSHDAAGFVSTPILAALTRNQVYVENTQADPASGIPLHRTLSQRADLLVVYPASARVLSQCALGEVTCAVTRLFAFTPKQKVVVAPAIHPDMEKSLYDGHVATLKRIGCTVLAEKDYWASWKEVEEAVVSKLGLPRLKKRPADVILDKLL